MLQGALLAVVFVTAVYVVWDYRQPEPLLTRGPELIPVTLEDQQTAEWLAQLRTPRPAPRHAKPGRFSPDRYSAVPRHHSQPTLSAAGVLEADAMYRKKEPQ